MRSAEMREVTFTVKSGELRRLRTGWQDPSSSVRFDFKNGDGLVFDNLAYRQD
jgi:alpha-ketoglutarate-dependent taurine dioxygenase